MIDVSDIKTRVAGHTLVREVDKVPRGHVRLETAFLYPDGSSVDLFVKDDTTAPLLPTATASLALSDLGQTMSWLLDVQVKPSMSKKRQQFVEDAIRLYDVKQEGGALETRLRSLDELMTGIVRLGQACVRVADLIYTRRTSLQVGVGEEIEEFPRTPSSTTSPRSSSRAGSRPRSRWIFSFAVRNAPRRYSPSPPRTRPRLTRPPTRSFGSGTTSMFPRGTSNESPYSTTATTPTERTISERLRDKSDVVALSDSNRSEGPSGGLIPPSASAPGDSGRSRQDRTRRHEPHARGLRLAEDLLRPLPMRLRRERHQPVQVAQEVRHHAPHVRDHGVIVGARFARGRGPGSRTSPRRRPARTGRCLASRRPGPDETGRTSASSADRGHRSAPRPPAVPPSRPSAVPNTWLNDLAHFRPPTGGTGGGRLAAATAERVPRRWRGSPVRPPARARGTSHTGPGGTRLSSWPKPQPKGFLRGNTITLDEPVPPLEGCRVRVLLVPADDELEVAPDEQRKAWQQWVDRGPQGPIEDEDDHEFPVSP